MGNSYSFWIEFQNIKTRVKKFTWYIEIFVLPENLFILKLLFCMDSRVQLCNINHRWCSGDEIQVLEHEGILLNLNLTWSWSSEWWYRSSSSWELKPWSQVIRTNIESVFFHVFGEIDLKYIFRVGVRFKTDLV